MEKVHEGEPQILVQGGHQISRGGTNRLTINGSGTTG